jgi:hypothetical protein
MVTNNYKQLASRFINSTACPIFLTGRAGTGKTTFLREIVAQTHKKTIVAAPTGIAAINAGGITLHSLFQLPFGSFIPSENFSGRLPLSSGVNTPRSLIRSRRFPDAKRKLLREVELLIIDEVSMLRADLLDAIDTVLRHIRRKHYEPFGGLQLLFIGDLLQLPPVIKNDEWELLKNYYPSLFFFHASVLQKQPPLYIELNHIYRQSDPQFISLLNGLRDNSITQQQRQMLNERVNRSFTPTSSEGYVYLTTHNYKADQINQKALRKISKPGFTYEAKTTGNFPENLYPVDYTLEFKEGAQVMFIKNDHSGEQKYFNGKIGIIDELSADSITVRFNDGSPPTRVERYTWENKKFMLNTEKNEIEEELIGTFLHFPIKLAWAITVHKSQGLTFEKAVIDVANAFAPGQIYVALSRLTKLEGLILSDPIPAHLPPQENCLKEFSDLRPDIEGLKSQLKAASMKYIHHQLLNAFDFYDLNDILQKHIQTYNKEEGRSKKQSFQPWAVGLHNDYAFIKTVADRFQSQLKNDLRANDLLHIYKRVNAAISYFTPPLNEFSKRIFDHVVQVNSLSGVKKYIRELRELEGSFFGKVQKLHKMEALVKAMLENTEPTRQNTKNRNLEEERDRMLSEEAKKILKKGKAGGKSDKSPVDESSGSTPAEKNPSALISGRLFNEGIGIEEIALARSLAISTIESHLAKCVGYDIVDADNLVEPGKQKQILAAIKEAKSRKLSDIMALLGDGFTYGDIKVVLVANPEVQFDQ